MHKLPYLAIPLAGISALALSGCGSRPPIPRTPNRAPLETAPTRPRSRPRLASPTQSNLDGRAARVAEGFAVAAWTYDSTDGPDTWISAAARYVTPQFARAMSEPLGDAGGVGWEEHLAHHESIHAAAIRTLPMLPPGPGIGRFDVIVDTRVTSDTAQHGELQPMIVDVVDTPTGPPRRKRPVKAIAAGVAALATLILGVAAVTVAIVPTAPNGGASDLALREIPGPMLAVYEAASATCPGLPWPVLAAIGAIESHHGEDRVDLNTGDVAPPIVGPAIDGRAGFARMPDPTMPDGWAHALGPMQFLSTTWRTWGRLAPGRPFGTRASVQNAWDSIYSAAAYLCGTQGGAITDLDAAILSYNHSPRYLADVVEKAIAYGLVFPGSASPGAPSDGGASAPDGVLRHGDPNAAVAAALTKLGVPYVYGATGPDAFDCSGLTQWAYRQAGVMIPRVTYDQLRVGIAVPVSNLAPGDLLFSRGDVPVRDYGHVAMYMGDGLEVVAPHTGDVVKIVPVDASRIQAARRIVST